MTKRADLRTGAGKQWQMRRTCDNKQTNIAADAFRIVTAEHCSVCFAYCIMLTKGRAGLLKLDGVRLSVMSILLCKLFVWQCKLDWSTTDNQSGRISDWSTQILRNLRGFHEIGRHGSVQKKKTFS